MISWELVITCLQTRVQGYNDIYSPVTFKCTQEFVSVTFHSYSALIDKTLQLAMYKSYK